MSDNQLFENLRDLDFLNLSEAAHYLRCSEKAVSHAAHHEGLPFRRLGVRYVFHKEAIKKWFDAKEQRSIHAAKEKRQLGREMATGWQAAE